MNKRIGPAAYCDGEKEEKGGDHREDDRDDVQDEEEVEKEEHKEYEQEDRTCSRLRWREGGEGM